MEGKEHTKAVDIEGLLIPITRTAKITDKMKVTAAEIVRKMEEYYDGMMKLYDGMTTGQTVPPPEPKHEDRQPVRQEPAPAPKEEKTGSVSVEVADSRQVKETYVGRKAAQEDIIAEISSGMCIVKVGEKKAIADRELNIRSEVYEDIRPAGSTYCYAFDSGKFKLIHPDGQVVVPVWLEGLSNPQDGVSIVRSEGMYNLLDLRNGKLFGDTWYKSAGQIRDGWSMVQNRDGKFNYVNRSGELMTQKWFDSATEFTNGLSVITRDGTTAKINNKGKVLDVLNQSQSNGMGGPGR